MFEVKNPWFKNCSHSWRHWNNPKEKNLWWRAYAWNAIWYLIRITRYYLYNWFIYPPKNTTRIKQFQPKEKNWKRSAYHWYCIMHSILSKVLSLDLILLLQGVSTVNIGKRKNKNNDGGYCLINTTLTNSRTFWRIAHVLGWKKIFNCSLQQRISLTDAIVRLVNRYCFEK